MNTRNLFGEIAVRQNYVTQNKVDQALAHQKILSKNGKKYLLGELLVESGVIKESRIEDILNVQELCVFLNNKNLIQEF